jgi:hypothetical protein
MKIPCLQQAWRYAEWLKTECSKDEFEACELSENDDPVGGEEGITEDDEN